MEENKEIETVSSETTTPAPEAPVAETPAPAPEPAPVEEKPEIEMLEPIEKLDDDPPAVETLDEPAPAAPEVVVIEEKKEEAPAPAPAEPAPAPVAETPAPQPEPAPAPEPVKEEVKEEPKAEEKKEKPKKSKKEMIPIIIIVVGLIVIVVLAINMFTKKEEPSGGSSSGSEETNPTPQTPETKYIKLSDDEMAELFNNTFNAREKEYAEFFKDGDTFKVFNSKFASLFTTSKVEFAGLFTDANQKYEAAHAASGFTATGSFKVDQLKKTYESLFGGATFVAGDYKIDDIVECKADINDIICNTTVVTGGTATPRQVFVKYSEGEQVDDIITLTVYAVETEDGQSYTSKGVEITELKGLDVDSALSEANLTVLGRTKYKVVFKADEVGTTLQYVEPIA